MQHKGEVEEKTMEFEKMFMSLDEPGRDEALQILRTLATKKADTSASDLKRQKDKQTI